MMSADDYPVSLAAECSRRILMHGAKTQIARIRRSCHPNDEYQKP
jgi:hypothetical protein